MAQKPFPLLRLPPELRDKVYEEVVALGIEDTNDHRMVRLSTGLKDDGEPQVENSGNSIYRHYVLLHGDSPLVVDPEAAIRLALKNPYRMRTSLLATSKQVHHEVKRIIRLFKADQNPLVEFRNFTDRDMFLWCRSFGEKHTPREFAVNNFLPCVHRDPAPPIFHHFCVAFNFQEWKSEFDGIPFWTGADPKLKKAFYTISRLDLTNAPNGPRFCRSCHRRLENVIHLALRDAFTRWKMQKRVDMTWQLLLRIHVGIVKQVAENRNTTAQWNRYLETVDNMCAY